MFAFSKNVFALLFLTAGSTAVNAQNSQTFTNDAYEVIVKENKPSYSFRHLDDPDNNVYNVDFSKIYERDQAGGKVGGSNLALASMNWVVEEVEDENLVFWINGTTKTNGNSAGRFSVLAFKNYVRDDQVKFDLLLNDYDWVNDASASLDLEWKMTNSTSDGDSEDEESEESEDPVTRRRQLQDTVDPPATEEPNEICFFGGEGDDENQICWAVEETAQALDAEGAELSTVDVTLDYDTEAGGFIVVSYAKWDEGNLFHDPAFGFLEGTTFGDGDCSDVFILFRWICWIKQLFSGLFS